ncbi:MAG: 50S ribosomal protein L9 [Ignavibacteriales bacterium]|nr:50S ribosomal protein L9 [Ignavibacteriales bacterium]
MKIILRKNIETLGKMGDVLTVKDGYARNYLLPRNLAYVATAGSLRALEEEKRMHEFRHKKEFRSAQQLASGLQNVTVTVSVKVGEEGRLFGSVTSMDIANELKLQKFDVDKRMIELDEPIKSIGTFPVTVKLHTDVKVVVQVKVVEEAKK